MVSVNLAVALHRMGKQVMLLDADVGMANAQIALGIQCPYNLSHFLSGEKTLQEIIVTTSTGVRLVPGASGMKEMAALSVFRTGSIVQAFSTLDEEIDYLIVDLAAGISPSVLAFIAACPRRIIVVRDDPSSIADAYGMIKILIQDYGLSDIYLVLNDMNSHAESHALFERMNAVCARFLNQSVNYLGTIETDNNIVLALRKHKSVLEFAPDSTAARDFRLLAIATEKLAPIDQASGGLEFFVEKLVRRT